MQAWGLIVLLVSKAAGHSPEIPDMEQDKAAGVLHSQRALAEVTEMIRTSHLVHKGLVNMNSRQLTAGEPDDMMFGNKIALLSGDYLLANSCSELANLSSKGSGEHKLKTADGERIRRTDVWQQDRSPERRLPAG
ncbi:hypothetical protein evm_014882 [Chilo suppressalis]|nr:hypothetical protein evm_014882 [Chilo suppressalis]